MCLGVFWGIYGLRGALRGEITYRGRRGPDKTYYGFNARLLGYSNCVVGLVVASVALAAIIRPVAVMQFLSGDGAFLFGAVAIAALLIVFLIANRPLV